MFYQNVTDHHSVYTKRLHYILVTIAQLFFSGILSCRWTLFTILIVGKSKQLTFFTLYNQNTNLDLSYRFLSKPCVTFQKNSTFCGWFGVLLNYIQVLLICILLIIMWSWSSPISFINAQWYQCAISLCQDVSKSQKQQENCNYTQLPSSRFIFLFVN